MKTNDDEIGRFSSVRRTAPPNSHARIPLLLLLTFIVGALPAKAAIAAPTTTTCLGQHVDVTVQTDDHGGETRWDVTDSEGVAVMSGGPYESNEVYTSTNCLADGNYTFTIYDSYGDGICCSEGEGSYSLKVGDDVVKNGGDYENFEATPFTVVYSAPFFMSSTAGFCTHLYAAGWNEVGQFGHGESVGNSHSSPILVGTFDEGARGLSDVSAGDFHAAIVKADGTAWTAGWNELGGQLGHGDAMNRHAFAKVNGLPQSIVKAVAGYASTFFLVEGGDIFATGNNEEGQLGLGDTTNRPSPVQVDIFDVVDVASGFWHTLFLKKDGSVYSVGRNIYGQLCLGDSIKRNSPVKIPGLFNITQIETGDHSLLLQDNGTVWSCGYNGEGQLGVGDNSHRKVPTQVSGLSSPVMSIAKTLQSTMMLLADGSVRSTGSNYYGELGAGLPTNNSTYDRSMPGPVSINGTVTGIYGSQGYHFHLIKDDGSVWGTGLNGNGQIGISNAGRTNSPVEVVALAEENVAYVAGGDSFAFFVVTYTCSEAPSQIPSSIPTATPTKCFGKHVNVTVKTDLHGIETSWGVTDSAGGIVMSGGPYERSEVYTSTNCLPDGNYTFTLYDSSSNGICCSEGEGSYSLKVGNEIVKEGGVFESFETTAFTVAMSSSAPSSLPSFMPTISSMPSALPTSHPSSFPSFQDVRRSKASFEQDFSFRSSIMNVDERARFMQVLESLPVAYANDAKEQFSLVAYAISQAEINSGQHNSTQRRLEGAEDVRVRVTYSLEYESSYLEVASFPEEFLEHMSHEGNRTDFEERLLANDIQVILGSASEALILAASAPVSDSSSSSNSLSVGLIIGIVVGIVACLGLLAIFVRFKLRQIRKEAEKAAGYAIDGSIVDLPIAEPVCDHDEIAGFVPSESISSAEDDVSTVNAGADSADADQIDSSITFQGGRDVGFMPNATPAERQSEAQRLRAIEHANRGDNACEMPTDIINEKIRARRRDVASEISPNIFPSRQRLSTAENASSGSTTTSRGGPVDVRTLDRLPGEMQNQSNERRLRRLGGKKDDTGQPPQQEQEEIDPRTQHITSLVEALPPRPEVSPPSEPHVARRIYEL